MSYAERLRRLERTLEANRTSERPQLGRLLNSIGVDTGRVMIEVWENGNCPRPISDAVADAIRKNEPQRSSKPDAFANLVWLSFLFANVTRPKTGDNIHRWGEGLAVLSALFSDITNAVKESESAHVFRQSGSKWEIRFGDEYEPAVDGKAAADIHAIMQHRHLPLIELPGNKDVMTIGDNAVPIADREDYRTLMDQIYEIKRSDNPSDIVACQELESQLNANFDDKGNSRRLSSTLDTIEDTTRQRVRRWRHGIAKTMPNFAKHLECISITAAGCSYDPPESLDWEF